MTSHPSAIPLLALLGAGCARVDGAVHVLNGPTDPGGAPTERRLIDRRDAAPSEDGRYALSPTQMTITLTYVSFVRERGDVEGGVEIPLAGCTATYDRALASLAPVGDCAFSVPEGTYGAVRVGFSSQYTMRVADGELGVWSDPEAPGLLVTDEPAGGAADVPVTDQNTEEGGGSSLRVLAEPLVIREGDAAPAVYVVFDPTHWFKARLSQGTFQAPEAMGNPPVLLSLDGLGAATWYTNLPSAASYRWEGCDHASCMSLLFLYGEDMNPTTVTWQDASVCPGLSGGRTPVVAFAGGSDAWGDFGRLGRDASGVLAWASGEQSADDSSAITNYTGVYRLPEAPIGGDAPLTWRCGDAPEPASGATYASGAPAFEPDGGVTLRRLY